MKHSMKGILCMITRDPSDLMEDGKSHTLLQIMWHLPNNDNYFNTPFAALVTTQESAKFYDATFEEEDESAELHVEHIIQTLLLNLDELTNSALQGQPT